MPNMIVARLWFILALLCSAGWHATASAQNAPPSPPVTAIAPSQASQVLDVLRDDKKRAQLEQTLRVIATATGDSAPAPAPTPTPDATPPAEQPPVALVRTGLVAQLFTHTGVWLDSMRQEIRSTGSTVLQTPAISGWWRQHFGSPEARARALDASWAALVILILAFAAEWLIARALKRLRSVVAARAAARFAQNEVRRSAQLPLLTNGGNPPPMPENTTTTADGARSHERNLSLLRRVPYAMANCVLELLPLAGFLIVATLLLAGWGGTSAGFYDAVMELVGAYVAVRISMCVVRLVLSPSSQALRLTHLQNGTARYLHRWVRRIVATAVIGTSLANVAQQIGATADVANVLDKLVALAVHIMLIIVVIQTRHIVAAWIRHSRPGDDGSYSLRGLLADAWAPVAIFVIAALWIIWTLGVANGFQQLLHYLALTVGIVLLASVVSILTLGALDRAFFGDPNKTDAPQTERPPHQYYHTLVQRAVRTLIITLTIIALLQVWGLDALSWFRHGTVGRRVASAVATIAVACALAIFAWESINFAVRRKIDGWTQSGDAARAIRLRTLVPILRTTLFIIIALIVLLTALNQLGINIAPLLAGASILGVALGFGSQKLVQDFITGIFLLMENTMQVGDTVTVAGLSGTVEYLSIRTVRLRAGDGSLHVVPFSSVSTVTNANRGIGNAAIRVSVRADADIDAVIQAIKKVGADMREDPKLQRLILADLDLWGVDQVDGSTVTLAGQIRTVDNGRWPVQREFNRRILMRFRELGIQFFNPQETVYSSKKLPETKAVDAGATGPAAPQSV